MDSTAQLTTDVSRRSMLPDLRGVPLVELTGLVTDGDAEIRDVADRTLEGAESPAGVQAMIFNSAI